MSLVVTCETCRTKLSVPDEYEGRVGLCPTCGGNIRLVRQAPPQEPPPPPPPAPAKPAPRPAAAPEAPPTEGKAPPKRDLKFLMVRDIAGVGVVRFATSRLLDAWNVDQLGEELTFLVKDRGFTKIVLNFSNLQHMSSAVIGKLIALHKLVAEQRGKLRFSCIDPSVLQIFKLMKLDKLITIYDTEEDAVESFRGWFA